MELAWMASGVYGITGAAKKPMRHSEAREWLRKQVYHRQHTMLRVYVFDFGQFKNVVVTDEYVSSVAADEVAEGTWPEIWETFIAHVRMQETA